VSEQSVPPLNWLRAFEASARLLSFTKAAQELNMSQSAVSQQMRSLESYLGQVLFLRGPRVLKLTEVGRNYLPVVQQALAGLSRGTRALSNKNKKKSLTIQCNLAFSMFWLAPRLQSFQHQNPWITVRILSELWPPMATEENADVEIRFGYRLEDKLGVQRLFNDTCFPVCSPDILEAVQTDWTLFDLYDCSGMQGDWEAWFAGTGKHPQDDKPINYASTFGVSLSMAMYGAGLSMANETFSQALIDRGLLARPFEESIPMPESHYLIHNHDRPESEATRIFKAWLETQTKASWTKT